MVERILDRQKSPSCLVPQDNLEIWEATEKLRKNLEALHNQFNQATDPALVDSIIYEMQAVQLRYTYYLNLCKEREIIAEEFIFEKGMK